MVTKKTPQSVLNAINTKVGKTYNVKIVAYPDESKQGYVNMEKIIAYKQGEGSGSAALREFKQLCKDVGFKGITISVQPLNGFRATTADDVDRLIRWYANNGFILTRTSPIPQMELRFK